MTSFRSFEVVATNSVVSFGSDTNSTPVIGSSDSCTTLCLVPRSCIKSPRMTVTAPLAKPTASWDRSSRAVKADIYKIQNQYMKLLEGPRSAYWELFASIIDVDNTQAGRQSCLLHRLVQGPNLQHGLIAQVLLQTISTYASLLGKAFIRTETVTSKLVPSTWRMWVMRPVSCAWKLRTTFQLGPIMRTYPLSLPMKRLSEPEHTLEISLFSKDDRVSSSPSLTWLTSKKSNAFH